MNVPCAAFGGNPRRRRSTASAGSARGRPASCTRSGSARFVLTHAWIPLTLFAVLAVVSMVLRGDQWLADRLYAWQGHRWALRHAFVTEQLIHRLGRDVSTGLAGGAARPGSSRASRPGWRALRRPLAYLLVATALSTALVAWVKSWSNMDCPWDLVRYGGAPPYVGLFAMRPLGLARGACFPAGHASAGYAWLALYFFFLVGAAALALAGPGRRWRAGPAVRLSQQLRGAHFLSHDLWTAGDLLGDRAGLYLRVPSRRASRTAPCRSRIVRSRSTTVARSPRSAWLARLRRWPTSGPKSAWRRWRWSRPGSSRCSATARSAAPWPRRARCTGAWPAPCSRSLVVRSRVNMLLLCVLLNRWTAKPVLIVLLLVTAVAAHFMSQYTVYLDADMIRNILHTDGKESGELVSLGMLPSLLVLGVLPSLLVWRVRLRRRALGRAVLVRGCMRVAGGDGRHAVLALASFQDLSALMRNHRERAPPRSRRATTWCRWCG